MAKILDEKLVVRGEVGGLNTEPQNIIEVDCLTLKRFFAYLILQGVLLSWGIKGKKRKTCF